MSTSATVAPVTKSVWGGGQAPLKATYGKLMMWFFLLSDAFTFSGLLIAYGLIRVTFPANSSGETGVFAWDTTKWPVPEKVFEAVPFLHGVPAPLVFVGIMTFILILSSVTMVLAVEAGERMDKKSAQKWMLWTLLGGITFLSCQAWEWSHFIAGTGDMVDFLTWDPVLGDTTIKITGANLEHNQYGPPAFADLFFFITGFHGFHVFSGVVINFIIFYNIVVGAYQRRGHYEMVEKAGLYWHFVDLVWVFVFTFFYLI